MKKASAFILFGFILAQAGPAVAFNWRRQAAFECYKEGVPPPFFPMCVAYAHPNKMKAAAWLDFNFVYEAVEFVFPFKAE